jgi:4-amino-4-deoxy-L-arabinose transferase-like glycosyltransferase
MTRSVVKYCGLLLLVYTLIWQSRIKFTNEAYFGGDSGGYQIMAVNWAKGFGLMKNGGVAGDYYNVYHLSKDFGDNGEAGYQWFLESGKNGGYFQFYRMPGYIVFLGIIYKIFGISPEFAKHVQLELLIVIAAGLPFIGNNFWKKGGLFAGFIAGLVFLYFYGRSGPVAGGISYPSDILSETLTTFAVFVTTVVFILWEKKKNLSASFVLGVITGLTILIKSSTVFLPVILVFYFGLLFIRKKINISEITGLLLGLILVILSWSIYATDKSGKTVFLSTQTDEVLLEGNNEFSVDGGWHPEGYSSPTTDIFYNRPEIRNLSLVNKLIAFYKSNPDLILKYAIAKIRFGFESFIFLKAALILLTYEIGLLFIKNYKRLIEFWKLFSLFGVIQVFHPNPSLIPIINNYYFITVEIVVLVIIGLSAWIFKKRIDTIEIPLFLVFLILNFVLISLVIFGYPRFIQVIDWLFILLAVRYGMRLFHV